MSAHSPKTPPANLRELRASLDHFHEETLRILNVCMKFLEVIKTANVPPGSSYTHRKVAEDQAQEIEGWFRQLMRVNYGPEDKTVLQCFSRIRPNGPFQGLDKLFQNAHEATFFLPRQLRQAVIKCLALSNAEIASLKLNVIPENAQTPPVGRFHFRSEHWLSKKIKKHMPSLCSFAERVCNLENWKAELQWEYARVLDLVGGEQSEEAESLKTDPEQTQENDPQSKPPRGTDTGPGRKRMTVEEANAKAMKLAQANDYFVHKTQREWADAIGCSDGLISKLPLWREVAEQTGRARKGKAPGVVSLTRKVLATTADPAAEMTRLIADQKIDDEADTPNYRRKKARKP